MQAISRRQFLASLSGGALALALGPRADAVANDPFTIATIGDIHVTDATSLPLLEKAVARINGDAAVQFTVVLGDVATLGRAEELRLARGVLDRLQRPCFVVPGNHDANPDTEGLFDHYKAVFGPLHWVHRQGGWVFIGMNSCEGTRSDVTVPAEELAWVAGQLKDIGPTTPVALFSHHPLNPNTQRYRIQNADAILGLFENHNLKLAAAGHWHGNQVERANGVLFTTTACCTPTRNNFDGTTEKGYRLFHLGPDHVETEFVVVA